MTENDVSSTEKRGQIKPHFPGLLKDILLTLSSRRKVLGSFGCFFFLFSENEVAFLWFIFFLKTSAREVLKSWDK